jgi:hypothetical protein
MAEKDIVSKDILKRIAIDMARVLLHLKVDHAEIIETEYQRIEDRRADLVARMDGEAGEFILHVEIQNDNYPKMPWRMLRYRAEIGYAQPDYDIRQYLLYIGKNRLTMADGIQQSGMDYRYHIIDMHTVDCETLLNQGTPEGLVFAILCDFKGRPEREVVHYILQRLRQLTAENETRFREYVRMLEVLSTNRDLEHVIEEEEKMLSQVDQTRLPSFRIGMQQGMQEGMQQGIHYGEEKLLERQLTRRFGPLSPAVLNKLQSADLEQLERWAENVLFAQTLDEVFNDAEQR